YFAAAAYIEPNTTLMPISFSHVGQGPDGKDLSVRVSAFRHAGGYLAVERHLALLKNYEATTGYFPILYRPELNPYTHMGTDETAMGNGLESVPPSIDLVDYTRRTGQPVDYLLIWGLRPEHGAGSAALVQGWISQGGYELVWATPGSSLV